MMEYPNDWDLQAVVRSCCGGGLGEEPPPPRPAQETAATVVAGGCEESSFHLVRPAISLRDLDYLGLDPRAPFSITAPSSSHEGAEHHDHELLISFPDAAASTSGRQQPLPPRKQPGAGRTPRPKRSKKAQLKKVVCEVPVADGGVSTDLWAWRKYGQKPIKGSPYPRGYYKCSSLKVCVARKLVERSTEKPDVLVVTYIGDHCHAVPTMLNALAGTSRHRPTSPDNRQHGQDQAASTDDKREDDSAAGDASSMTLDDGAATPDDGGADPWPPEMLDLDDFLSGPPFDDDFVDRFFDDGDGVLGRRLSL